MKTPVIAALALVAAVVVVVGVVKYRGGAAAQNPVQTKAGASKAARVPVETAKARASKITSDIRAIGSLQSDESVRIAPEIAGRLAEILFSEGDTVKQGDVLLKFDDSLVRAEVVQAQARQELAKANLGRATRLASTGAGTTQDRDEATAEFAQSQAAIELASVRQSKHAVTAPFAGVVGIRNVSVGAFVAIGTEIVNLEKIDALKVDFKVPEIFLAKIAVGQTIEVIVDAYPGRTFPGTIYAIDPMVDVNGRAIQLRARLPNPDRVLRPGLFARIVIKGLSEETAVFVPESALVPRGGESFVYRIDGDKAVETKVRLGERKGGEVAILEGIMPDAVVVTAGHQRLRDGTLVEVVPPPRAANG